MKRLIALAVALVFCFFGVWYYKINAPVSRPDEYQEGTQSEAGVWWDSSVVKSESSKWTLDPSIPLNYIPVPGEDELYMVVDTDGKILSYRKRKKQIDGSWEWEDVNPDIPEGYEPVPGLKNVYKVTKNGKVKYYKYIRNDDDTYAFVEVDKNGKEIRKDTDATKIDGRHVKISGNIYKRLNENGVLIGYDKRVPQKDGSYLWVAADAPKDVDGSKLKQLESEWSLNSQKSGFGKLQTPSIDTSDIDAMAKAMEAANSAISQGSSTININISGSDLSGDGENSSGDSSYTPVVINNPDGTHTEEKTVRESRNIDGNIVTTETYVKNTYDADGNLIKTETDGPYTVDSKAQLTTETPDPSKKEKTVREEMARVTSGVSYDEEKAGKVFALLNAKRVENGLQKLTASTELCELAMLRVADMAAYGTDSDQLPTYGSIKSMMKDYGVSEKFPGINQWMTPDLSASDIHTRLQAVQSSRDVRTNKSATEYGCAAIEKDDELYFCEIVN